MSKLICLLSARGVPGALRTLALACLAASLITACGGDSGPAVPPVVASDGMAMEQKAITLAPAHACEAPQGADVPARLNTELDCAP